MIYLIYIKNINMNKVINNKDILIKNMKLLMDNEDCSNVSCSQCILSSYFNKHNANCDNNYMSTILGDIKKDEIKYLLKIILSYNKNNIFEI